MSHHVTQPTLDLDAASVLDMLPVGACVLSEELVVIQWNQKLEEWTGLSREDVLGSVLSDHFPNLREPRYFGRLQQVFSLGMPARYSAALHKHFLPVPVRHGLDGLAGEFMVQETEVRLCSYEPKLAFCTIQDFSFQYGQVNRLKSERADLVQTKEQLERTNRRLRARNEELDEFCHVASHDLQKPLNELITLGQLMERQSRQSLGPDGLRCLDGMLENCRQLRGIIIDLLALSRAGLVEPNMDDVSVQSGANVALELLEDRIANRSAIIELDDLNGSEPPRVVADVTLLAQLYQNLISNALKFTPPDRQPKVRLTAERDGIWWRLGVTDNGQGIADEQVDQVFRPFHRIGNAPDEEGSGVGLAICKQAVQQMGGEISITSQFEKGSTVTFTLLAAATPTESKV